MALKLYLRLEDAKELWFYDRIVEKLPPFYLTTKAADFIEQLQFKQILHALEYLFDRFCEHFVTFMDSHSPNL